jgi:peptide/nickel transport system ATP-binding protein
MNGTRNAPRLVVEGLSVELAGQRLLSDVTLELDASQTLGLVGASGSGKSLTALAIAGLLPEGARVSGSVRIDGEELIGLPESRLCRIRGARIGLVTQEPATALNPLMTIGEQVAETILQHRDVSRGEALRMARAILDEVGLPASRFALDRYPHELSGGQRQRVAIAIAVALRPALLIADEPTTALDVTVQAQVLELLKRLSRSHGISLLFVSHDLAVVGQVADRIAVMDEGRVVERSGPGATALVALREPASMRLLEAARHQPMPRTSPPLCDSEPLLKAQRLHYEHAPFASSSYGTSRGETVRAVDGVDIELHRGERLAIVGESGSGKTTLLRLLLGLQVPTTGQVLLAGQPLAQLRGKAMRAARRRIQAVFQDPYDSFNPHWKVGRIVAEPLALLEPAVSSQEQRRRVEAALARVGLPADAAQRYPHAFSGGQRQRIAIARALIVEPDIVVLDEAVSALDIFTRNQVLDLLAELSRSIGIAWLFVSHDLAMVRGVSDRVAVMQAGRIVETGDTASIFSEPRHPYTQALLAAVPRLPEAVAT